MANVYIKTVSGGEDTTPSGTDAIPLDDGTTSKYALLSNLHLALTSGTDTVPGVLELATNAEAVTGTDTARATTPAGVAAAIAAHSHAGTVIQVVNTQDGAVATGTTTMPLDDTIPQNTEGDQYMTRAITPTSATNKLKIDVVWVGTNSSAGTISVALFQDTTANALASAVQRVPAGADIYSVKFTHYMTSLTTSATTFKVRAGSNNAGTTTFNGTGGGRIHGGVMASSITITEIKV